MLTASPSPRLNPNSSSHGDSASFLTPRSQRKSAPKAASPIVKPHSAHVVGHVGYSNENLRNLSSANTNNAQQPTPSQCSPAPLQTSFQPQVPSAASVSIAASNRPCAAISKSTSTQTLPIQRDGLLRNTQRPHMVDASTQYSPPLIAQTQPSSNSTSTSTSTPTPAARIASLQIQESAPLPQSSSSPNATQPTIQRLVKDFAADAAMPAAPPGTVATSKSQNPVIADREPLPKPTRTSSTSVKRNLSTSDPSSQPQLQLASGAEVQNANTAAEKQGSTHTPTKKMRPEDQPTKIMPADYSVCNVRDLVLLISSMLMDLIRYNDTIPLRDGALTRFHSRAPPGISVVDYLQRLTTHATLLPPILLSMVYYIDKLCALFPQFTISSLTVHRFLITAATVASKGLSDSFWTNKTYARVGGVSVKELALLELEFLTRVQWRIVPAPETLREYYASLVARTVGYEMERDPDPPQTESTLVNGSPAAGASITTASIVRVTWSVPSQSHNQSRLANAKPSYLNIKVIGRGPQELAKLLPHVQGDSATAQSQLSHVL